MEENTLKFEIKINPLDFHVGLKDKMAEFESLIRMNNFSWHSEPGLAPHWYKIYGWLPNRYLPIVMFGDSIPVYKPNMKGGHRHNHIRNAHMRMRKCNVCGEPIVNGCEYTDGFSEFQCRSCRTEECRDQACIVGLSFGGVTFQTRRRRK